MGLFDYVRCEVPLPDGFEGELQTKDFDDAYLERYTITKNRRLTLRYVAERLPVPEEEWKYVGSTDTLEQFWHEQSKTRPVFAEKDMDFHGVLNFYASSGNHDDGTYKWHEYNAKFTDGNLVEIAQVEDR